MNESLLQQITHQVDIRRPLSQATDHADHLPAVQRGVIHEVPDDLPAYVRKFIIR